MASLPERLNPPFPSRGWRGWLGPIVVTIIGGLIRLWDLGRPHEISFDETYYVKDAIAYLRYGVEHVGVDKANDLLLASDGDWRTVDIFTAKGAFVVHPPLGKWTIAVGEFLFGATPFGWRVAVAVLGTAMILMTARIMRRMTRSDLIGTIAGLLLALDGIHIVLSRTGLLDMVLAFWVLVAFGLLVIDRDRHRARMARFVDTIGIGDVLAGRLPSYGWRPVRILAIGALALAVSVKWSALWFLAVFVLMSIIWDVSALRAIGARTPWRSAFWRAVPVTALEVLLILPVLYALTWTGWFVTDSGWGRTWGANEVSAIPQAIRAFWHYHAEAWHFHVNLQSAHAYKSNPLSWPLQTRPTSFAWASIKDGSQGCPTDNCAREVLALGNPIIWWAGAVAMVHQLWRWLTVRDWRSGAVLAGIAAGWLPWLLYLQRTIFTFYTVVYVPFVVMALALTMGTILGPADAPEKRRARGALVVGSLLIAIVIVAWWFYPIWTGQVMPYREWQLRMWLPTWV